VGESGGEVLIVVRDLGPGIPADLADQVFDPFFRPAGWAEASGNWGLGLSLVRQIALRHGGVARCAGDGEGARFEVRLPIGGPG
jgi:signal transduction histidine kinase